MKHIMKRNIKKMMLVFTVALALNFGMGVFVSAASSQTGSVGNYDTTAKSTIKKTSATGLTSCTGNGTVSVSSTYSYVNTDTLATGTTSRNNGAVKSCSVSFSAPTNCRSVKITSSHSVTISGQKWTASTSATY